MSRRTYESHGLVSYLMNVNRFSGTDQARPITKPHSEFVIARDWTNDESSVNLLAEEPSHITAQLLQGLQHIFNARTVFDLQNRMELKPPHLQSFDLPRRSDLRE